MSEHSKTIGGLDTSLPADEFKAQIAAMRAQVQAEVRAEEIQTAQRQEQKAAKENEAARAAEKGSTGAPIRNAHDREVEERQKFVEQCAQANEKGDGLLFNELQRGKLVFVPEFDGWLQWSGQFWRKIWPFEAQQGVEAVAQAYTEARARLMPQIKEEQAQCTDGPTKKLSALQAKAGSLQKRANALHQMKNINACLKASLANESRLTVPSSKLDGNDFVLVTESGVVDIRSAKLSEGRPEDYFTRHCPVLWKGIDEPSPKWERMVFEILGESEEMLRYFHKLLGMAICGDTSEKIFVVLLGAEGDSGKTTIFEILYSILTGGDGDSSTGYAAPMPVELLLDQGKVQNPNSPTPVMLELRGQRICWASEPGEGTRFSVDKVKLMSGNDSLVGRSPYDKSNTKFRPSHTLFLLTNHKMRASGTDSAFWKRIHLVNCPYSFVQEPKEPHERPVNRNLKREILEEEASGVLAWLVRGYQLYMVEGLQVPEAVKKATREYREEENIVMQFRNACMEEDTFGGVRIAGAELYAVFRAWFEDVMSRRGCPSITTFGKMAGLVFSKEKKGGKVMYSGWRYTDETIKAYPKETQSNA